MNPEYKQLLIKDLSCRLPYRNNVRLMVQEFDEDAPSTRLLRTEYIDDIETDWLLVCKPYLRPLSSMTDEEEAEIANIIEEVYDFTFRTEELLEMIPMQKTFPTASIDWFYEKGFDIRGLIPLGLAEIAPEGMYNN